MWHRVFLGLKDKTPQIFKITSGINSLAFWTQSPPLSSNTCSELHHKSSKSLQDMYLQEGEEGSYCIVGLEKSETQEREEKGKNPKPSWLPKSYECTACMVGTCLARARSPDNAYELSWHLPSCGYATTRKNPLGLFATFQSLSLLSITGTKSLCLQWRSATAGLGLDGKNTLQQTQCGWGHKSSPSQPSHAAPPPPAATRKVPNSLRAALVPAPRVLLLHFTGDFTIVAWCFGHWTRHFDASRNSEFQNSVSRNPSHSSLSAAK